MLGEREIVVVTTLMNKKCVIMRGLPGCGKDHTIEKLLDKDCKFSRGAVVSTDDFFMVNGEYHFDVTKLAEYHNKSLQQFTRLCVMGVTHIIVNNTNIRVFEIAPYYRVAEAFGYEPEVWQFPINPELSLQRNIHNVPESTIQNMARSLEALPHWWNVKYLQN